MARPHVSRHWREVALTSHSLWTDILVNMGIEWIKAMLKRAGPTVPLSITVADHPEWDEGIYNALDVFPTEMHRVRRLSVWGDFGELASVYARLADIPAPLLESLHFAKSERWDADCGLSFEGIFAGQTPRLAFLHLDGVGFPWKSFYLFKNLTYIRIYSYGNGSGVHALPEDLLTALSHMPKLKELLFEGCVLDDWTGDDVTVLATVQRPTVELEQLSMLTMEGPKHVLDFMVKHLVYPESCTVNLVDAETDD